MGLRANKRQPRKFKVLRSEPFARFSIMHTATPEPFGENREDQSTRRLQEVVQIMHPGNLLEMPVLVVTAEHKERWPEEYLQFRQRMSWWMRFRLWLQHRAELRLQMQKPDAALDHEFNSSVSRAFGRREFDQDIQADINKALAKS